jgi:tripartite-type tricarboxylate transporter receptor subunit TctC
MKALRFLVAATIGQILAATAFLAASGPAAAQSFPTKPVRFVVPYPAGGGTDAVSRIVAQQLSPRLGQPVLVDNQPGAGGNIGGAFVARATPDGYTLLVAATPMTTNPSLYRNIPFDVLKDFAPVSQMMRQQFVLMAHPSVPVKSVDDIIALAKRNPKALSFASHSAGGANHLAGELLKVRAGIELLHVPYKGAAQALNDLLAGTVSLMFENSSSMSFVEQGRLFAIATSGPERTPLVAGGKLPTVSETKGLEGFNVIAWFGLLAPAGTPAEVVERLSSEVRAVLQQPEIRTRLNGMGYEVIGSTPRAFGDFMRSEVDKWSKVVSAAQIKLD